MAQDPFLTKQSLAGVVERVSLTPPPPVLILEGSTSVINSVSLVGVTTGFSDSESNPGGFWIPEIKAFFQTAYQSLVIVERIKLILMSTPIFARIYGGPFNTRTFRMMIPFSCQVQANDAECTATILYKTYEEDLDFILTIRYSKLQKMFYMVPTQITAQGLVMENASGTLLDISY